MIADATPIMNRAGFLALLDAAREPWDLLVVGGGATGLGAAVDAAARGYRTLLAEAGDFAGGTSSRSTKLVHGGVRYLRQGDVGLVLEALRERGRLLANAPHLVRELAFVIPTHSAWEGPFYGLGLKLYDLLAGRLGLGPSHRLSREETLAHLPTVEPEGLTGGVLYHDAQFDDARLALTLARTLADLGGVPLNYLRAVSLLKSDGLVAGAVLRDEESGRERAVRARAVINATGVWADEVRRLDDPGTAPLLALSQGIHLVLERRFLPGRSAVLVPHTDDGRVLFAVPWHGRVVVGTTDTPLEATGYRGLAPPREPRALPEEIDFLLAHASRYLAPQPRRGDVLAVFAGLRPLVREGGGRGTADLSRDHAVAVSPSGLVTVTGGKWTTYRKMGEDAVDRAALVGGLAERPSRTADLRLHGAPERSGGAGGPAGPEPAVGDPADGEPWSVYGSESAALRALEAQDRSLARPLHPRLPYRAVQVTWAVRHEMARTVEDVLARRTRALLLDARAAAEMAPAVADLMAAELGEGPAWRERQVAAFRELAAGYLPPAE
jgi:glycerol-3-phosphate dehydrogenase